MNCSISIYLAYAMAIYVFASIFYLLFTNIKNIGTPFNDSLNPEQMKIKNRTTIVRGRIFYLGIFGGLILSFIFRPFKKC